MKKRLFVPLATLAALVLLPSAPRALGDTIQLYQDYFSYSNGGEFGAKLDPTTQTLALAQQGANVKVAGYQVQTFCIEYSEEFYPGRVYDTGSAKAATFGGLSIQDPFVHLPGGGSRNTQNGDGSLILGGLDTPNDPISQETAYLYRRFWDGDLPNYDFTNTGVGRSTSAGQLQAAIWYLEGEASTPAAGSQTDTWVTLAHNAVLAIEAHAMTDPRFNKTYDTSLFGVAALNLTDPSNSDLLGGTARQSQLVVLTGGDYTTLVPVPAAAWMGVSLLGLMGIGHWSKRRLIIG
jgi:hypothetical protein